MSPNFWFVLGDPLADIGLPNLINFSVARSTCNLLLQAVNVIMDGLWYVPNVCILSASEQLVCASLTYSFFFSTSISLCVFNFVDFVDFVKWKVNVNNRTVMTFRKMWHNIYDCILLHFFGYINTYPAKIVARSAITHSGELNPIIPTPSNRCRPSCKQNQLTAAVKWRIFWIF